MNKGQLQHFVLLYGLVLLSQAGLFSIKEIQAMM